MDHGPLYMSQRSHYVRPSLRSNHNENMLLLLEGHFWEPQVPLTKSKSDEPPVKSYHFNLKLKPETVPQWDGNANTLARWLNKINCLADGSVNVHRELGKIVPQRFTSLAETWYYSIPDYECIKGEVNWSCL